MASKRMFAAKIICEDDFRCLSPTAQALYFSYCMAADDWGIVGSPVGIMRSCAIFQEASDELAERGFIFEIDGRVVIRHWFVHNQISPEKRAQTNYPGVLAKIKLNENDVYELAEGYCFEPDRTIPGNFRNSPEIPENPQNSPKFPEFPQRNDSMPQNSPAIEEEEDIESSSSPPIVPPTPSGAEGKSEPEILTAEEKERLLTMMDVTTLMTYIGKMWTFMDTEGKTYRNPAATIEKWYRQDHSQPKKGKRRRDDPSGGSFETDEFFEAALARSYRGKNSTSV